MAMTLIARIPLDYSDFGSVPISPAGVARLDALIEKRLPDGLERWGDEIVGPLDFDPEEEGLDIDDIIRAARDEIFEDSNPEYWEYQEDIINAGIEAPADLSEEEIRAFGMDIWDGVLNFWEPGYDYDDPDFWSSYESADSKFIQAVRAYDRLRRKEDSKN